MDPCDERRDDNGRWVMTSIPTLETDRLILRGWRAEDVAPAVAMFMHDPGMEHIGGPNTEGEAWRRVATMFGHWVIKGFGRFAVEEKSSGRWIGYVGLSQPPDFPGTDLGWSIRADMRGQGIAQEAARRVRAHAFEAWGFTSLMSFIAPANMASRRVAERLGATRVGEAEIAKKPVEVWRHVPPTAPNDMGTPMTS
jgi:RimJ/RimL family protein N-acetyltransferase